ncbi:glycosyl transferase [Smithella sp. F21]|nr:glycosyl transferase [Smithella sp. F21]
MDMLTDDVIKGESPVCSVCIANYNGRNVIEACLNSVFRQVFSYPIEVIVHDDASTDGSYDIISDKFPNVRLIRSDTNVGFCVSNNRMVAAAQGRFILLLNNDAELHQNALSTLYHHAEKEKVYGIIGLPQYNKHTGELIDVGSLLDPFLNPVPNLDKLRPNVAMVIGACMWFPKKLWDELGGFPEWFESIAEDMYLCCLARLKGYPVVALPDSGFDHYVGGSFGGGKVVHGGLRTTYRRRALSERNKSYVMILCYPGPLAYILIPLHLLLLTIEGIILSVAKGDQRIWSDIYKSCLKAIWTRRQELSKLRREIQNKRIASSRSFYSMHSMMPYKLTMLIRHGLPTLK